MLTKSSKQQNLSFMHSNRVPGRSGVSQRRPLHEGVQQKTKTGHHNDWGSSGEVSPISASFTVCFHTPFKLFTG